MTDPTQALVRRKESGNTLTLRGVAILALSVPIVAFGGLLAIVLPSEFEAVVALLMVFLIMFVVLVGGGVMIRGALRASWAERALRKLEEGSRPRLPAARLVQR